MATKIKMEEMGSSAPVPVGGVAEVGRMVDCSQADDRRMIRLVRERRLLYARNNMPVASYYAQVKALWEEVANEMSWSVADVRRKWSHIRNSYSRHLRNEMFGARTGKGRVVSKWYLADELEFLREHMATDMRSSPYTTYAPPFLELDLAEQSSSPEHASSADIKSKPFLPWFALPSASPAPGPALFDSKYEYHNEDSSSSHAFAPDENSSYFQFFRGIYNDYQELSTKNQRKFKRQCLTFLHDLLDEEERPEMDASRDNQQSAAINLSNVVHVVQVDDDEPVHIKTETSD